LFVLLQNELTVENKKARHHGFVRDSLANRVNTLTADREFAFRIDDQLAARMRPGYSLTCALLYGFFHVAQKD
jgi:hypothetical protein